MCTRAKTFICLFSCCRPSRGCPKWISLPWLKREGGKERGQKTNLWLLVYLDIGLAHVAAPGDRATFPLLTFCQLVNQESQEIFLQPQNIASHIPHLICYFSFILLLVRRGICIFSWAGRKAVYGLDVAMFVSLIVTWWRCQSTSTCGNLIAPATWRTSSQLEYIQIRNQEIPEAGLRASLSNVYFLVWIWIDDKPYATFFCQKILNSLLSSSTSPSIKNACSFVNSCF